MKVNLFHILFIILLIDPGKIFCQDRVTTYRFDLAKGDFTKEVFKQQVTVGQTFKVVLLPYTGPAAAKSNLTFQYRVAQGSDIDTRASPVNQNVSIAAEYSGLPDFKLENRSESVLLIITTPDTKVHKILFEPTPEQTLALSANLSDTVDVDLKNYRETKIGYRTNSDFSLSRVLKKGIPAHKRFYVPSKVPISVNFLHPPKNHNFYINGEQKTTFESLRDYSLKPGENTVVTIIEKDGKERFISKKRMVKRYNSFVVLTAPERYPFKDSTNLEFVGDAAVQNSLSNPVSSPSLPANFGLGAIYSRHNDRLWFNRFYIEAFFNISSSLDTVRIQNTPAYSSQVRELGTALLIPSTARQSFILNTRFYFNDIPNHIGTYRFERFLRGLSNMISGISIRSTAGNRLWTNYKNKANIDTTFKVGVAALKIGVFREFLPNTYTQKGYSVVAGMDWDSRTLTGDLRNGKKDDVVKEFQEEGIKNTYTRFSGVGFYLTMQLKNIRAGLNYNLIYPFEKMKFGIFPHDFARQSVFPGLTGGQFAFSVAFTGGFPVKISNGKD